MSLRSFFLFSITLSIYMFLVIHNEISNLESERSSERLIKISVPRYHKDVTDKKLSDWRYGKHEQVDMKSMEATEVEESEVRRNKTSSQRKFDQIKSKTVILMWTNYYSLKGENLLKDILSGRKWDPDCCSGEDLIVTVDRSLLPEATVVVFYNYMGNLQITDLPTRYPGQLWVLFGKESPIHSKSRSLSDFSNLFNWTMTYRLDSDIYSPYGFTQPLHVPIPTSQPILMPGDIPLSQWIQNKKRLISGVASHCRTASRREKLVEALRNASLPVDIYGRCGKRICPRTRHNCDHDEFWHKLGKYYVFYFAGENSLCVDYITEKFWRTLELGLVPVVYGGINYSEVAPPNSFIDVLQFDSPKEIADYLRKVANDPEEYAKFFEWKRKYRVQVTNGWGGWCKLCRLARQYNTQNGSLEGMEVLPNKTYEDLRWWWRHEKEGGHSACKLPPFSLW